MNIENTKSEIQSLLKNAVSMNIEKTPHFYFFSCLKSELDKNNTNYEIVNAAMSMNVSLSALGEDFTPHKDWIREMAALSAKMIKNVEIIYDTISKTATLSVIENLSLNFD